MKKLLLLLVAGLMVLVSPAVSAHQPVAVTAEVSKRTTVYITKTGSKFHTSDCRYLKQSKIKTTKKEAVKNGYEACKVCKP